MDKVCCNCRHNIRDKDNDGTLSLVERVGHYNKLEDFLNWIREDKDNE